MFAPKILTTLIFVVSVLGAHQGYAQDGYAQDGYVQQDGDGIFDPTLQDERLDPVQLSHNAPAVSIPEPASMFFGLACLALGIGGGLLIRKKNASSG